MDFLYSLGIFHLMLIVGYCHSTKHASADDYPSFKELYFEQYIDHFNFKSHGSKIYKQKYLLTSEYMKQDGPIFFYAGNEGPIEDYKKSNGFVIEQAPKFGALLVFAEHRFYGVSLPFGNSSFSSENLGLLTAEQALADYAYLLKYLKSKYCQKSCPVIAFGGSYGGQLAAYLRFQYPDLVQGSLASSVPIYSTAGFGNPSDFFKSVTEQYKKSSQRCVDLIKEAFYVTQMLANQGKYPEISRHFQTCDPVNATTLENLYEWLRTGFTILAMLNYPYPDDLVLPLPANPVNVSCYKILQSTNVVDGLHDAVGVFYNATIVPCYDIAADYVKCADPTGCGPNQNGKAWDYQACTEMTLPSESNNKTDMFPPLSFTYQMRKEYCEEKYGVTPRVEWLDVQFWGKNISSASNIIFSNGDLDPWASGGIHHNLSSSIIALEIKGGAHTFDLKGSNPKDPQSVIEVRRKEEEIIKQWIDYLANHGNKIQL